MSNPASSVPSFLRDALVSYTGFSNQQKQDVQKRALKWLQVHINTDLTDKTILEQFTQKWRFGASQSASTDQSPLLLENLPGSYKGNQSINGHQEEALVFLQNIVPVEMQADFQQRWNAKSKLEVSSADGASFKVDDREIALLQQEHQDGDGTTWYLVEHKQVYYLLSSELQGNNYQVVLAEEISPQNRSTWFVAQDQVKISNV